MSEEVGKLQEEKKDRERLNRAANVNKKVKALLIITQLTLAIIITPFCASLLLKTIPYQLNTPQLIIVLVLSFLPANLFAALYIMIGISLVLLLSIVLVLFLEIAGDNKKGAN